MPEKYVLAEKEMSVHKKVGKLVESVTLLPGDTFPFDDLADYQQETLTKGKIDGLKVETKSTKKEKVTEEVEPTEATEETKE